MIPIDLAFEEATFQAIHVVDLQQTLDIRRRGCGYYAGENRCLSEGESAFDAGWLIGSHPSDRRIYAYMGSEAVAHIAITGLLERFTAPWAGRAWEGITISVEGVTVIKNARFGLTVRF